MPQQHQSAAHASAAHHVHLKKLATTNTNGQQQQMQQQHRSHPHSHGHVAKLQHLSGMLEVKFKGGAFSTWSDVFVRLEGRWLTIHKRERDATRIGAIELGPGISVTDLNDTDASTKFPRRFDLFCKGGCLPATEIGFRTKSRKDRDLWALAIATNIDILNSIGLDLSYAIADLEPVITRLKEALPLTPIRIRSDLAIRCASGEAIVAFLVAEELASDRTHANIIGRRLLAMNVIHHVVWEKGFVDASSEQYTLAELDDDLGYEVEHFAKYLDSRKFWKYFDASDAGSSNGSARSGRSNGRGGGGIRTAISSTGSSSSLHQSQSQSQIQQRGSATTMSHASNGSASHDGQATGGSHKFPPSLDASSAASASAPTPSDKKAKHCSVCKKSFNPLRRRYACRSCAAVVCSHCSMARKIESVDDGAVTARVCVGCKLSAGKSQDDFYDAIFTGAPHQLTSTMSTSELSNVSGSDRTSSYSQSSAAASVAAGLPPTSSSVSSASASAAAPLRRKSSTVSTTSSSAGGATGGSQQHRPSHASSSSTPPLTECPHCANEACGPVRDFFEVPYPVAQEVVDRQGNNYITANELDNETARLRSVQLVLGALETTPALKQMFVHFASMATIATSSAMAKIGLLERNDVVVVAQSGTTTFPPRLTRDVTFTAHCCRNGAPLVCSDMSVDVRFSGNPWRRANSHALFYAGVPVTLANGHTVGALEVLDSRVRFACAEVVVQLQAVVRGIVKNLDEVVANAPVGYFDDVRTGDDDDDGGNDYASVSSIDSSMSVDSRPDTTPSATSSGQATVPRTASVQEDDSADATATGAAPASASDAQPSDSEMELRLMELLSQTTNTQEQLKNQQGHMVHAITSHSKQITELAKQLERMESTLNAKLDA